VLWFFAGICFLSSFLTAVPAWTQSHPSDALAYPDVRSAGEFPILGEIRFTGLRRIAPAAVAAQIRSRSGDRFEVALIEKDVRTLARLGWFESIRVEEIDSAASLPQPSESPRQATLIFYLEERPFLSKVDYTGSKLLSKKQIEKMLEEKKLSPRLGEPADPAALQRIAAAIQLGLNELSHPEASVQIHGQEAANATVSVQFEINDGPHLPVRQVSFVGNPQFSTRVLHSQMQSIAPWKPFASWRSKDAFTPAAYEDDREKILTYYQNRGYPEARIGRAQVTRLSEPFRSWLPWPHQSTRAGLSVAIPIEAGPFYRFTSVKATEALLNAAKARSGRPTRFPASATLEGQPFSQQEVDKLRRSWLARIQPKNPKFDASHFPSVDSRQALEPDDHYVRVTFDLSKLPPFTVRRIEFQGLRKFSDRYVRRRILLREGHPIDERALEAGLARLARTGYFKPVRKENIRVQLDETNRTAGVSIHLEEIGQQRASLVGGRGQFGSTLGIAYTVFDLLHREELLSAQLEGGPESLQIVLGLAEEGIFGTRASLAFSVFNNILRPRFVSGAQGPFFNSRSEGITVPLSYPLTTTDSLGVSYTLSRTITEFTAPPLTLPAGVTIGNLRTETSSRSLGAVWTRDTAKERASLSNSVSGGWLGGDENMLRSSAEYSRIFHDPIFAPSHAWAFRTAFSGAGSYHGNMPYYARLFSDDGFVRGLGTGELGPFEKTARTSAMGARTVSARPAGANLVGATNAEYRVPLGGGTEAVGFFDLGSGLLLPNWLGPAKPLLLSSTNRALHASTGFELRWTVPGVQVPVRGYYALNVLRLDRLIHLSDKSIFLARNRLSSFGWGLGSLF